MALIAEKDELINLIERPNETMKEKVELLIRQKEQLKLCLLSKDKESLPIFKNNFDSETINIYFWNLKYRNV